MTATSVGQMLNLTSTDVAYVCMPLFHSNALSVGWAPSLICGYAVALARRFSASMWLRDIRHYGATYFNYTGKPLAYILATPEQVGDDDNPLRIAMGNEGAPKTVTEFAKRFDVEVIDVFGATEGGLTLQHDREMPPGAIGRIGNGIEIVDDEGRSLPRAQLDDMGRIRNPDECVGEIVNVLGTGLFEGYYKNTAAEQRATRNGWYWSGDLGYVDIAGYIYYAGRTGDWVRVDGENFSVGPIESALVEHPDVVLAAVYGVPDAEAGDQLMACLLLRPGATFDPLAFAEWVDHRHDLAPKWCPTYVRITKDMPTTGTNKVLKRSLANQKFHLDRIGADSIYIRSRGKPGYQVFTELAEIALGEAFVSHGRARLWHL
jgi:fatty-acyl-CoA synthase